MRSIRDEFLSYEVQAHLAAITLNTLKISKVVAKKNGNFSNDEDARLTREFEEATNSDITVVARLYRDKYQYTDCKGINRSGSFLSLFRNVYDDHQVLLEKSPNLRSENVRQLYSVLREVSPLIQTVLFYRNYCTHNMKPIEQSGWIYAIAAIVIRICETALTEKSTYDKNSEIILRFSRYFQNKGSLNTSLNTELIHENKDVEEGQKNNFQQDLRPIKEKLEDLDKKICDLSPINETIKRLIDKVDTISTLQSVRSLERDMPEISEMAKPLNANFEDDISDDEENLPKVDFEFASISPEVLRQRLIEIGNEIKRHYGDLPSFGAKTNLVQVAAIGAIMQNEPKFISEFLELPEISSRLDIKHVLVQEQLIKYQDEIDGLLGRVLWASTFDR